MVFGALAIAECEKTHADNQSIQRLMRVLVLVFWIEILFVGCAAQLIDRFSMFDTLSSSRFCLC